MRDVHTIGLDELVDGYIKARDGGSSEYAYWVEFVDTLRRLLSSDDISEVLELEYLPTHDESVLDDAIDNAIGSISARPSPWSGFMEAPKWVILKSQTHGRDIAAAQQVLGVIVGKYLRTLLIMRWPGIDLRRATWADLARHGVDREPPLPLEWDEY